MKLHTMTLLAAATLLLPTSNVHSQQATGSFSFHAPSISGFPSGEVFLTGGGTFDPATNVVKGGGGFRCLADINQGPLAGCKAGEGIRWDTAELLPSTTFKCTGAATEILKTAVTGEHTVVIVADFYRQGDGVNESFTAKMIVSDVDLDPALPGNQTVWIEKVGCGDANVSFR
jgi:hypothetical protein